MGRGVTPLLQLRRGDEVTRTWPDDQIVPALEAFWSAVLEEGMLHERWYPTHLFIPGHGDLHVPRTDTRALHALGVRRFERAFLEKLAQLHSTNLEAPFSVLLEIPPTVPNEVDQVITVLRRALSVTAPLRHRGEAGQALLPAGALFTVLERHDSPRQWQLDLHAPVRLRVTLESGSSAVKVTAPAGARLAPLLDAFEEHGLAVNVDTVAALADS